MLDYNGNKNPNFGNKKLSLEYKKDKELSKLKQGRPGVKNGRATPIEIYYDGQFIKEFDYIIPCCEYLINIGVSNTSNPESIRNQINKSIRSHSLYKGHYSFVKR